jgi:hypothetical protein
LGKIDMPLHPAWVKNISRRVLWAALEKDISRDARQEMAEFFNGSCCYCGQPLPKRWHADHLVSVDAGGLNHISNRVPSCPKCNEHEKREQEWTQYLKGKCISQAGLYEERKAKIDAWVEKHGPFVVPISEEQRAAWKEEVESLSKAIDSSWKRLRDLARG